MRPLSDVEPERVKQVREVVNTLMPVWAPLRGQPNPRMLLAIAAGVLLGVLAPESAKAMKPIGDTFVNLVKMVIGPIIFLTIVLGIANMADLRN